MMLSELEGATSLLIMHHDDIKTLGITVVQIVVAMLVHKSLH